MRVDEVVWKQIGYMIVGIWGFLGLALLDLLINLWVMSILWIATIEGIYYAIDIFILFYIHYVFNIEPVTKEDALKAEIERREIELANK